MNERVMNVKENPPRKYRGCTVAPYTVLSVDL